MKDIQAAYDIVAGKLMDWAQSFVALLPNIAVALLVMFLFTFLGSLARKLVERVVGRVADSEAITRLVGTLVRIAVIILGVSIALSVAGLDKAVTSLLAGAGVLGLVVGIAFQDLAANFIAGVMMGFRKPFQIGDVVETAGTMGTVRKLNLRNTLVENFDGNMVIIPNRQVFENPLVNYSYTGARRIVVPVGVRYDSDLRLVVKTMRQALEGLDFLHPAQPVQVVAREFGASSIDFEARLWVEYPGETNYFDAWSDAVIAIKKGFDAAGLEIPFPIRTIDPGLVKEAGWEPAGSAA